MRSYDTKDIQTERGAEVKMPLVLSNCVLIVPTV